MKTKITHTKIWIDEEGIEHIETVETEYDLTQYPIQPMPNWVYPNVNTPTCCITCPNKDASSCNCTLPYLHGQITYSNG